MKGVPANESATAVCQDGWKGDCHGRAHFHIGPPVGQGRIQGPACRGRQFEEFDLGQENKHLAAAVALFPSVLSNEPAGVPQAGHAARAEKSIGTVSGNVVSWRT